MRPVRKIPPIGIHEWAHRPIECNSWFVTKCMVWAFIIPLGIQVLLFLTYPFWERTWFGDWFLSF